MASEINGKSTVMYKIIQANNEQKSNFRITIIVGGIHRWPWFHSQMTSNAETLSMAWRHHDTDLTTYI